MKIKIARYRNTPYVVNLEGKSYHWSGSKGEKVDIKPIPTEVVDFLTLNSACFRNGELIIIEETEEAKEVVAQIDEIEEYRNHTHSKAQIKKILEGNATKMKAELNKITNHDEKKFFIDVAKEIKLDSNVKLNFLATWIGIEKDFLFPSE